ncbi:MAG: hypothetical protein RMY35_001190 [Nostoc sp. DedSLP01]|nr:hypothetical protein [Nostoc sp. DedSLP01]
MPHRHYPPAYLRYLRARLWKLGRPGFWVTAIFLSVVGLVTWEYWSNPDVFVYKQKKQVVSENPTDSSLSQENKAIAADIDNLPVLFNDFDQAALSLAANNPKEKTEGKKSKGLLDELINTQKSLNENKSKSGLGIVNPQPAPTFKNPFIVQTENLLRSGTVDNNSQFLGLKSSSTASQTEGEKSSSLGIGLTNQTNSDPNSVSISPLQAAIDESTRQKSSLNGINANGRNASERVSDTGATSILPLNSLPSQIPTTGLNPGYTSTITNFQPNPYTSNQVPVVPSANSVVPNNIAPYSSYPNQSVVTPTNPTGYTNYGLQQPNQVPQPNYGNYGLQQPNQVTQPNYGNYGSQQQTQPTQSTAAYLRDIIEKRRGQN